MTRTELSQDELSAILRSASDPAAAAAALVDVEPRVALYPPAADVAQTFYAALLLTLLLADELPEARLVARRLPTAPPSLTGELLARGQRLVAAMWTRNYPKALGLVSDVPGLFPAADSTGSSLVVELLQQLEIQLHKTSAAAAGRLYAAAPVALACDKLDIVGANGLQELQARGWKIDPDHEGVVVPPPPPKTDMDAEAENDELERIAKLTSFVTHMQF
ncbi:uncharacterized protein V1510DRAFT_448711 [Dipodascopsis tothii]|uniref:uncharacterized protein n=1 Tax=Dipodascopsis tothii TaxID=44089 RepID=UPI0034CE7759